LLTDVKGNSVDLIFAAAQLQQVSGSAANLIHDADGTITSIKTITYSPGVWLGHSRGILGSRLMRVQA
jgi:hypothetical protein